MLGAQMGVLQVRGSSSNLGWGGGPSQGGGLAEGIPQIRIGRDFRIREHVLGRSSRVCEVPRSPCRYKTKGTVVRAAESGPTLSGCKS